MAYKEWNVFSLQLFLLSPDAYHLTDLGKEADLSADHQNNFMGFFEIK